MEYRAIDRCEGYRVGADGSVWTRWEKVGLGYGKGTKQVLGHTWRQLATCPGTRGYPVIGLRTQHGKRKQFYVHDLVLTAFIGPRPRGYEACHDPDPTPANCAITNLRWGTRRENRADAIRHGTHPRGEAAGTAKLTDAAVQDILVRLPNESGAALAREYHIGETTIYNIKYNRTWQHIPRPSAKEAVWRSDES
jgi:hypothetical protein